MASIRERHAARSGSGSALGRPIRIGAILVALLASTPLILANLPEAAPEDPRQVAITVEGLT